MVPLSVGILSTTDVPKMKLGVGYVPGASFPELKQAPSKLKFPVRPKPPSELGPNLTQLVSTPVNICTSGGG